MTKAQKKAEAEAFLDAVGKAMKAAAKEARRVAKIRRTADQGVGDGGRQDRGAGSVISALLGAVPRTGTRSSPTRGRPAR